MDSEGQSFHGEAGRDGCRILGHRVGDHTLGADPSAEPVELANFEAYRIGLDRHRAVTLGGQFDAAYTVVGHFTLAAERGAAAGDTVDKAPTGHRTARIELLESGIGNYHLGCGH